MTDRPETSQSASNAPALSLVIPAYNEQARIESTLHVAIEKLNRLALTYQVLVIDDGSTDRTRAIAERVARGYEGVEVASLPHLGKAAAVFHGMRAARGEFILFTDADLATPLRYIEAFVEHARQGADVVIASREGLTANRIGEPEYRHLMGRAFNQVVQLLLLPGIEDTQCGFKLFTREAARAILERTLLHGEQGTSVTGARVTAFDVELLVIARRLGYTIEVVSVEWTYGTNSKVNPITDSLFNLRDVALVKWNDLRGKYRD